MPSLQFTIPKLFPSCCTIDFHLQVFDAASPLIESVVQGYNATIFAYGCTGSGKTHTMYGNKIDPGVIPRSLNLLFERIQSNTGMIFC
jgi:hypothetical protein